MKRDSAVSPVIGSILLVAITVIIAAVIAAFVFGMTGDVQKTKIVAVTSQKVNDGTGGVFIELTNHGGKDAGGLATGAGNAFTVTIEGSAVTPTSLSEVVGTVERIGGTTDRQHIVVIGHFLDGTDQVVLDTRE
jgi:flagellin-like protein